MGENFIIFLLIFTILFIILFIPLHEEIHEAICTYFGGEVIERNFDSIVCKAEPNNYRRLADSIHEIVSWMGMLMYFLVVMIMIYIELH